MGHSYGHLLENLDGALLLQNLEDGPSLGEGDGAWADEDAQGALIPGAIDGLA